MLRSARPVRMSTRAMDPGPISDPVAAASEADSSAAADTQPQADTILAWYSPREDKYYDAGDPVIERSEDGVPLAGRPMDGRLIGRGQPPSDPNTKPGFMALPMQLVRVPISEVEPPEVNHYEIVDRPHQERQRIIRDHDEWVRQMGYRNAQ